MRAQAAKGPVRATQTSHQAPSFQLGTGQIVITKQSSRTARRAVHNIDNAGLLESGEMENKI